MTDAELRGSCKFGIQAGLPVGNPEGTPVIRKNSVPREISANVRDRSESDPAGATESVIGPAVIAYSPET